MTDTIQTPTTDADDASEAVQAEEFLYLNPAEIIIGTNVRTDLRADHKEFRKSIKERGVLEAVTVYRNEAGQYVLLSEVAGRPVGRGLRLAPRRGYVWPDPENAIDLVRTQHLLGLTGRDDEVGGELHLAEKVHVLEGDVELVVHRSPSLPKYVTGRTCGPESTAWPSRT